MNEKRKLHSDFINDKLVTREREWASDLAAQVNMLIRTPGIPSDILVTLYNMLKQLEDNKSTQPKSILRSLEKKIRNIKEQYGRRR